MKYENKINAIWFESFQLRYFGTLKYIFLVSKYLIVNSKHKMAAFFNEFKRVPKSSIWKLQNRAI